MSNHARHYLILGGASGIGAAVVDRLLSDGHSVTATCRDCSNFAPRDGLATQSWDASERESALDLPESLDGVVYLPGTINLKPFHRLTDEDFLADMEVNFFGAVRALQAALPSLKRSTSGNAAIVLFSSVAATTGMPFHASIGSAKAAIEGLTKSLAAELAPKIRVNAIAPSLTDTPLAASFLSSEERREAAAKRHPLERIGRPEETAELVAFLLGEGAGFMSGQIIGSDGGLSALRKF
jgi:NAD(P)-dependent dehydrogenase (short-subunit alcohol dehydrogenase family)